MLGLDHGPATHGFMVTGSGRLLAVAPGVLEALALDDVHRSALLRTLSAGDRAAWPAEELEALQRPLAEHANPGVRELVNAQSTREPLNREFTLDDRHLFVSSNPVASTGWSFVLVRPSEVAPACVEAVHAAISERSSSARRTFLGFGVLALVIAVGVGTYLNLVAVRPIVAFLRRVENLRFNTLEFTDDHQERQDEIGLLNHKFAELVAMIRAARDELTGARDALRHQVDERTAELQARDAAVTQLEATRTALEEAGRHKDQFLAMLGHELRNPLFAIRTAVRLLENKGEPAQFRAVQAVLDRQSAHMTRLVEGLLDVSRISENKLRLEPRPLDLAALLVQVARDREAQVAEHGVELCTDLKGPLWTEGDEVRLTQVFTNLLGNAIKFSLPGGRVWLAARREAGEIVARVRDVGVGMEPETLEHLFEPFRQAPQDLARSEGGLGLGLALAKGIVELHGGRIEAFSTGRGRGSEFVVRLVPSAQPPVAPVEAVTATLPSRRVLVVEDNEDTATLLARALQDQGHVVSVAYTGAEALERVAMDRPEVVLCDLGLPGVNGYEVARAVRADPALQHVVLVALSGYGQGDDVRRSREAGFDRHLTKPVDLDEIEVALAPRAAA